MTPFKRTGKGVEVRLPEGWGPALAGLVTALDNLGSIESDPAAARLSLPVYLGDDDANAQWDDTFSDRIDLGRTVDRAVFSRVFGSLEKVFVDREEASSLIRVLAELRLVVAARVGIEVEEDYERLGEDQTELLGVLGWLQHSLLEAVGVRGD